jgi:tetratricopeptide (TPR) repeat protein
MFGSSFNFMRLMSGVCALVMLTLLSPVVALSQGGGAKGVMDLVEEGSYYFLKHDFQAAIPPYQKALDLEKQDRKLSDAIWKVLVDNLGMAYGITGNLDKAKETFEYGISKAPDYPMFYYNMACTYAEKENMDKAIDYLKLAFDRRENMIPGEKMPDPATDDSFQRFMKDPKFLAALKELKQK